MNENAKKLTAMGLILALLLLPFLFGDGGCSLPFGPSAGPRSAVIVRESFDDTPAQSQLFKNLQSGDSDKYLASKQHVLTILDDDETGSDNQPLAFLVKYQLAGKMANGQHVQPELLIFTADMKQLLVRQSLPADATANTVLDAIKAHGG